MCPLDVAETFLICKQYRTLGLSKSAQVQPLWSYLSLSTYRLPSLLHNVSVKRDIVNAECLITQTK